MNEENNNTVIEQKPKKSGWPIVLIIVIILLVGAYFVVSFLLPLLNEDKEETTTTTTTTTRKVENLSFSTISDYGIYTLNNRDKLINYVLFLIDKDYFLINYDIDTRCKSVGDKVSFTQNNLKIEYTCNNIVEDEMIRDGWLVDATIDETYHTQITAYGTTCGERNQFTNGKYYITTYVNACGMDGQEYLEIEDKTGKEIYSGDYIQYFIKGKNEDNSFKYDDAQPILKNNVLYFVTQDKGEYNQMTTCHLKQIDLNKENPKVTDMGVTQPCLYVPY